MTCSATGTGTVAALFDTTVAVLLLRRSPPEETRELIRAAKAEIAAGGALLPAVAVAELLIGEKAPKGSALLAGSLARIPTAVLPSEAAAQAGAMGAFLRGAGAPIPFPDLLVAATAVWLEVPLLAWDRDYARSLRIARESASSHPGAGLWKELRLHPASLCS
jgi:predicted nucleic acid-binding protein